jgi:hypothetical protein
MLLIELITFSFLDFFLKLFEFLLGLNLVLNCLLSTSLSFPILANFGSLSLVFSLLQLGLELL